MGLGAEGLIRKTQRSSGGSFVTLIEQASFGEQFRDDVEPRCDSAPSRWASYSMCRDYSRRPQQALPHTEDAARRSDRVAA
jgi:hypothetical protein